MHQVDGQIGPIKFSLTGPFELTEAVVKFIRNLTNAHGGYYDIKRSK